jgi:Flp pilus assembly protein TadD
MKTLAALVLAFAGALAVPRAALAAADADEAISTARGAFLAGRYDDAESSWRYLSELGVASPEPEANLALTLRDKGEHEKATAQWLKASLLEGADGFAWNQRAWSYLATGRNREARDAFTRALDRSSRGSGFHSSSTASRKAPRLRCGARASRGRTRSPSRRSSPRRRRR